MTIKIAVGSCISIIVAESMQLDFASSAGIITLLSIVSTKWATLKLAFSRVLSFAAAAVLSWIMFSHLSCDWITFGIYIFLLVGISGLLGWKNTISVNAVIGTHFMATQDFGIKAVLNEFYLVLIGITVAIFLNLFHDTSNQKKQVVKDMRFIEYQLQAILLKLSDYLIKQAVQGNVWDDIIELEQHLDQSLERAIEYQENTFVTHPEYYIHYIEMRTKQCNVLHNLHYEIKKIRTMPEQAGLIADYVRYMSQYIIEMNIPKEQIDKLHELADNFWAERLPETREEFEGRAVLYHIIMDLEEFLIFKRRFIDDLSDKNKKIYWDRQDEYQ